MPLVQLDLAAEYARMRWSESSRALRRCVVDPCRLDGVSVDRAKRSRHGRWQAAAPQAPEALRRHALAAADVRRVRRRRTAPSPSKPPIF